MKTHRFGRQIKLPSTLAIKHQVLTLVLEDEIRALPVGSVFDPSTSPAFASLLKLRDGSPRTTLTP
jgi:hypothetical protein